MTGVQVDDLSVEYRRGPERIRPIDALTLTVGPGRLAMLLGPSGSGKTTLLSCLAGILTPTSGTITVFGKNVTAMVPDDLVDYRRNGVGIVFQGFNLVPSLTAAENVAVPLWAVGMPRKRAAARARELLADLDMTDQADQRPGQLSGGQQQRVAIARALVHDPPLLLADEPTAHLDQMRAESVLRILRNLANRGRTVLVSTHDTRLLPLADDAITLAGGAVEIPDDVDTIVRLRKGKVLFEQGDVADCVYVVVKGEISLERIDDAGITKEVARCGPGDYFGELGPLLGFPRGATACATTATQLQRLSVDAFRKQFGAGHRPASWGNLAAQEA